MTLDSATSAGTFYILDGTNTLRMLNTAEGTSISGNLDADWSPETGRVVFLQGSRQQSELYIADTNGNRQRLTDNAWEDAVPVFAPDGRSIAFMAWRDGVYRPYLICADGSGLRPVNVDANLAFGNLDWSPDGGRLVLQTLPQNRTTVNELLVVEAASGREVARLQNDAANLLPRWSPDGRTIAFTSTAGSGNYKLHLWDLERNEVRALGGQRGVTEFGWSPDGVALLYTANIGATVGTIHIITTDGRTQQSLQDPAGGEQPLMRRTAWSPDNCIAYSTVGGPTEPVQVKLTRVGPPTYAPEPVTGVPTAGQSALPVGWIYAAGTPTPCAAFR